jgi:hypothetical protein
MRLLLLSSSLSWKKRWDTVNLNEAANWRRGWFAVPLDSAVVASEISQYNRTGMLG